MTRAQERREAERSEELWKGVERSIVRARIPTSGIVIQSIQQRTRPSAVSSTVIARSLTSSVSRWLRYWDRKVIVVPQLKLNSSGSFLDASSFFIVAYVKVFVTEKSEGSIVTNPDCFSPKMR